MRAVIVHSPLVGPSSVIPLADALGAVGVSSAVPDLRPAIGSADSFRQAATAAASGVDVVIGHSGAGAFLPAIADGARVATIVFVDAVLPAVDGQLTPSGRFAEFLDAVPTVDGMLAPWNEWWPAELMVELVPDRTQRQHLVAEIPRVPRSFYDATVVLPANWWTRPAGYLQLSPAYDEERDRAAGWGWPTAYLPGRHLDTCTVPAAVADAIRDLLDRTGTAAHERLGGPRSRARRSHE
jgi:hypothetical protein